MREHKSTSVLISIIGGALIGDAIFHPWGALIGGIIGVLIGMNHQMSTFCKRLF